MKWFSRISDWADTFKKAIENLTRAIRDATEVKQQHQELSQRVSAEIRLPEEVVAEQRASQNEQLRIQRRISCWTAGAFIAAAVYAGITLFQWHEMHAQTAAILSSEAGWIQVSPEDITLSEPDSVGNRTAFTKFWIRNRGKTPLVATQSEVVVRTFPVHERPSFLYEGPRTAYEAGIIYPDYSKSDDPDLANANNPPFVAPLFEAASQPGKTALPKQIAPSEYEALLAGSELIVAYAKASYLDIFQRKHRVHTCRVLFLSKDHAPHFDPRLVLDALNVDRACLHYNAIDPPGEG